MGRKPLPPLSRRPLPSLLCLPFHFFPSSSFLFPDFLFRFFCARGKPLAFAVLILNQAGGSPPAGHKPLTPLFPRRLPPPPKLLNPLKFLKALKFLKLPKALKRKEAGSFDSASEGGDDLLSRFRSTIGAMKLNFSVRDGKRWILHAIITLISFFHAFSPFRSRNLLRHLWGKNAPTESVQS